MDHSVPRICIIYFSLSGQSRALSNLLASGIRDKGVEVHIEQIVTLQKIGYPFNSVFTTLKMMLLTFFRKRISIQPISEKCYEPYNMYVVAGPTWSYNPSGPVLDLLDRFGKELFKEKVVMPLISCRGYYRMHERVLKRKLKRCGASLEESIIFTHPVGEPWSTIGVFLKSAGYNPEQVPVLSSRYRHFGHTSEQLIQSKANGARLGGELQRRLLIEKIGKNPKFKQTTQSN